MTLIEFMHEHWFLTWLLAWGLWPIVWLAGMSIELAARLVFRIVNRTLRTIIVIARGWPPAHLDADGDWRPSPQAKEAS